MISLKDFKDLSRVDENTLIAILKSTIAELSTRNIDKHYFNDYIEDGKEMGETLKRDREKQSLRNHPKLSKIFNDIKAILPYAGSVIHSQQQKTILVNDVKKPGYTILTYRYGVSSATGDTLVIAMNYRNKIKDEQSSILSNRMVDIVDYDPTPNGFSVKL